MNQKIFRVRYINSKNSFCYLSEQNANYAAEGVTLKVSANNGSISYFTTQSTTALAENEIGINRLQAELLQLQENDNVMIGIIPNIPGVRRLVLSTATEDDYEIVELWSENIQSTLLHQIRVVNLHQKFVIWITNSIYAVVNVDAIDPVNPGRLDNLTEVEIAPPKVKNSSSNINHNNEETSWSTNIFSSYFNKKSTDLASTNLLGKYLNTTSDRCFILHPLAALDSDRINSNFYFNVYTFRKFLPQHSSNDLWILKIINPPLVNVLDENTSVDSKKSLVVRVVVLDDEKDENLNLPVMYVHQCLFKNFNIKFGAKSLLNTMTQFKPVINTIELTLKSADIENSKKMVDIFQEFLRKNCRKNDMLLNSNFIININNFYYILNFLPKCDFCLIDSDVIRNCNINISDIELTHTELDIKQNKTTFCETFSNCKEILYNVMQLYEMGLLDVPDNILIVGKPGTGKTSLIKMIVNKLNSNPFYIHTEVLSCKSIKGKTLDSLHKVFSSAILNLIYYQPSLLILDDLNIICGKVIEEDTLSQESLYFNRVSEMLVNILETCVKCNRIAVLATSESTDQLNHCIFSSRGLHLFKTVFTIDNVGKDDRVHLLKFLFEQNVELNSIDFDELAIKTEGFVVQDIVDFVQKATFECLKELPTAPKINMSHCDTALKNTVALSLQDIQLHSPGDRDLSDIGGLDDAKSILYESMLWPVKFPQVFDNAPLRLQSGLLLYGPPGTGKTVLAGAAAKQFGLRLISVKGPELLSKYIGASEQAVRNVFEKAQNAKPCILFFDEFDSLAPRRGHDSTGVTDRVVNQLLTQLDGIESLKGVCVLAATSRPDLLDPALLRPGRLDKQILCPLPNTESRLKILKSLSKRMTLGADIDLSKIAEDTESFSGADLQAVLYTAQLSVIQEVTNSIEGEMPDVIEITQNQLLNALQSTRPSLTRQEIVKYEKIYARFERGSVIADLEAGVQKATLA